MPSNANPADATTTVARTFHNCPPSEWYRCKTCRELVYWSEIRDGTHLRMVPIGRVGRVPRFRAVNCGPVNGRMILTGGTPALVKRKA